MTLPVGLPGQGGDRGYRSDALHSALAKVEQFTRVSSVISVRSAWRSPHRWAVVSNERAVANARAAATECSRLRVERAEVEQFLAAYAAPGTSTLEQPVRASAAGS